jgi:four helix bundle protein
MQSPSKIQRFEDLIVWQKAMSLSEAVYRATKEGPFSKDWGLRDQVLKAAVSIPSNIAEGYERQTTQEYIRFLTIAKGSAGEVRTQLILAGKLGYITPIETAALLEDCQEVSRMLEGLKRRLKAKG